MRKINYLKFILDSLMAIVFTLLFNKAVLGLKFHEVAGLAIGIVVLLHSALNWKWIKGVTLKLFSKKLPIKTRLGYTINVLLLVSFAVIIVTGIFISKELFPDVTSNGTQSFKFLHISSSYFALILIGIHLGLHWKWVMAVFKKIVKLSDKKAFAYLSRAIVVIILAFGIYSISSEGLLSKVGVGSNGNMEHPVKGEFSPNSSGSADDDIATKEKPADLPAKGGNQGNVSIMKVIFANLGIMSFFAIITYYLEKFFSMKGRKEPEAVS